MPSETMERESVTKRTHGLLDDFENAGRRVADLRRELNRAECALANASNALSRWLIPAGAKAGEQYNIWYGNRIVSVVVDGSGREGTISIRKARSQETTK